MVYEARAAKVANYDGHPYYLWGSRVVAYAASIIHAAQVPCAHSEMKELIWNIISFYLVTGMLITIRFRCSIEARTKKILNRVAGGLFGTAFVLGFLGYGVWPTLQHMLLLFF